ncbi:MAG: PTS sugar transporter subunit IIA [Acidobacteriota bacterium]|nr:PTS sugar transporter subunit IIA [Acidobacteriota bacterium]
MLGLLVVTHGQLAEDLVQATTMILGPVEDLEAVSIGWNDDVDEARRRIDDAVARVGAAGDGTLILTDMFGGTPTNMALSLLESGSVEVVTGVNLPMVIKFANLRERIELSEVARRIAEQGRDAIQVASERLEGSAREPGGGKA